MWRSLFELYVFSEYGASERLSTAGVYDPASASARVGKSVARVALNRLSSPHMPLAFQEVRTTSQDTVTGKH